MAVSHLLSYLKLTLSKLGLRLWPGPGLGPVGLGLCPAWARARLGPGSGLGPGPVWARARFGRGPGLAPGPACTWARFYRKWWVRTGR